MKKLRKTRIMTFRVDEETYQKLKQFDLDVAAFLRGHLHKLVTTFEKQLSEGKKNEA